MIKNAQLVCLIFAFGLFCLGCTNWIQGETRIKVVSAGLAFLTASMFLV